MKEKGHIPQISIIVPVYNVEMYLCRCVDSILNQTFKDYELILIDDGSSDNSSQICDMYAKKYDVIQVIHKKNEGVASARNIGIKESKGKYIMFCDSDDYVSPFWCENFMKYENRLKESFVFCEFNIVGNSQIKFVPKKKGSREYDIADFFELQCHNKVGFPWNGCYYGKIIRQNKIYFPRDIIAEDLPFVLEYVSHMKCIFSTGKYDYNYYQDDRDTLSRKYYTDIFRKWREKYWISKKFIEKNIEREKQKKVKKVLADFYLYPFLHSLENTFDARNQWRLLKKIAYNYSVVRSAEFQECLEYADCSKEGKRYIWLLKKQRYILAYLLQRISRIKGGQ